MPNNSDFLFKDNETVVSIFDRLETPAATGHIVPCATSKLPSGDIKPAGWLKKQLEIAISGMPGQLWKYSDFLAEGNGWLCPKKRDYEKPRLQPWEETGYFLRYFTSLAILTGDKEALSLVERYMAAMLDSALPNGYFGPEVLLNNPPLIEGFPNATDLWPHMVVCEAIWTWYEFTKKICFLDLLHNFLNFCGTIPEESFIPKYVITKDGRRSWRWQVTVQNWRACDILPVLFKVYEETKDENLLSVADRFHRHWDGPQSEFLNFHTVNFSQEFAYETLYSRRTGCNYQRKAADYWYNQHMSVWGTLPRGAFCADELMRAGCTDPRYATESCTFAEFNRSFNLMGELNAETIWADRSEDVIFNYFPAAFTYDMKGIHYLTAANQVMLDDYPSHNVYNKAHMFAYSPLDEQGNRCCRHNAALGWPLFAENLIRRTSDSGLIAWMYAPCRAEVNMNGSPSVWNCRTAYPFRSKVRFELEAKNDAEYTFYFRIPGWCNQAKLNINGKDVDLKGFAGKLAGVKRVWHDHDVVELDLPSEISFSENPRNGGVTVDKGPFSYSLCIEEEVRNVVSTPRGEPFQKAIFNEAVNFEGVKWIELLPKSPWNYGLVMEKDFIYSENALNEDEGLFQWDKAPNQIMAHARRIPAWKLQDHMCAELQNSPVRSSEPDEVIKLIPMGCARLRLSVFPVISDAPWANEWKEQPESTPEELRPPIRGAAF